jgi:osmotically inducible protein OsmC
MQRVSRARWNKAGWDGGGTVSTESGVIREEPFSWRTRNAKEGGTNPEELLAAALAGCFAMALAFALEHSGYNPEEINVTASVSLSIVEGSFMISGAQLAADAKVGGVDQITFFEIAHAAKLNCPVSMVLNLDIALEARLVF